MMTPPSVKRAKSDKFVGASGRVVFAMTTMPEHEAENDNAHGSDYSRISRDTTCKTTCLYGCFNALQLLHAINAALVDFSNQFLSLS